MTWPVSPASLLGRVCLVAALGAGWALSASDAALCFQEDPASESRPTPGASLEAAKARLAEVEADQALDEAKRTHLTHVYREIVHYLEAERADSERAEAFLQALQTAPAETERLRAELSAKREARAEGPSSRP